MEKSSAKVEQAHEYAQRILDAISDLYLNPERVRRSLGSHGIEDLAADLGMQVLRPRKKVTVLVVGNHSAGKSSFINWYVGDDVRKTSVAVESKGFTVVTHGKRSEAAIRGAGTLKYFPHLAGLQQFSGVLDHLTTESTTACNRNFECIDFIDTPGLLGYVAYPFDVNRIIAHLATVADVVLVFLDPIGQALCSRTMDVVKLLNKDQHTASKVSYWLTKVDTIQSLVDLNKVATQVTQNLTRCVANTHGFSLPTMFLPGHSTHPLGPHVEEMNQVEALCQSLDHAIRQKVHDNLRATSNDLDHLQRVGNRRLTTARTKARARSMVGALWVLAMLVAVPLPIAMLTTHLFAPLMFPEDEGLASITHVVDTASHYTASVILWAFLPSLAGWIKLLTAWLIAVAAIAVLGKLASLLEPARNRTVEHLTNVLRTVRELRQYRDELFEKFYQDTLVMQ